MTCTHCHTLNRQDARFCRHCGAPLTPAPSSVCPGCGATGAPGAVCPRCGRRFPGGSPA